MFKSAKIKLTFWYLFILTVVTVSFSTFVYTTEVNLAKKALDRQKVRIESRVNRFRDSIGAVAMPPFTDTDTLVEIKEETLFSLVILNLVILGISGALSYFLAGKTLKPIEEMLEKQKRFLSDAAHELKTPLTIMKTNIEVSLRDKDANAEDIKKTLSGTVEEINRINGFVNKLLKQGKYQSGVNGLEKKEIKISGVIKESIKDLTVLASEKEIKILREGESSGVYGDEDSLKELFKNLIENAIKYSPNNQEVRIKLYDRNNDAITEITDKGIGISKEDRVKIFDPFFRSDKSRTRKSAEGFGLGLAICKGIVEKHGGTISVNSEIEKGSTFTVTLPIYKNIVR
jgi:two-component system sensor histidine kinase CiaH